MSTTTKGPSAVVIEPYFSQALDYVLNRIDFIFRERDRIGRSARGSQPASRRRQPGQRGAGAITTTVEGRKGRAISRGSAKPVNATAAARPFDPEFVAMFSSSRRIDQ